ncbi:MAG: ROK family protein [Alistipes sp.]
MKENIIGVDIGGTKCAVTYGQQEASQLTILDKACFLTTDVHQTIEQLKSAVHTIMERNALTVGNTRAIGISCGGPLDSRTGVVMSPPNLPGWDNIPIVEIFQKEFGIRTALHNDANACALAEWQFGAGVNTRNMIFLTFGTGLGAGMILNGKIYTGTNDNAGELGHIRLSDFGPVGYGKCGSFEGFCSGGGIRQLAQFAVRERLQMGEKVSWCPDGDTDKIDARLVAEAAAAGDPLAKEIYRTSAHYLGKGLSIIIDLINPEMIVIGSIYTRNETTMRPYMDEVIAREALPLAHGVCRVVPALLGEAIGDYAALSVAANA